MGYKCNRGLSKRKSSRLSRCFFFNDITNFLDRYNTAGLSYLACHKASDTALHGNLFGTVEKMEIRFSIIASWVRSKPREK